MLYGEEMDSAKLLGIALKDTLKRKYSVCYIDSLIR